MKAVSESLPAAKVGGWLGGRRSAFLLAVLVTVLDFVSKDLQFLPEGVRVPHHGHPLGVADLVAGAAVAHGQVVRVDVLVQRREVASFVIRSFEQHIFCCTWLSGSAFEYLSLISAPDNAESAQKP